jgi:ubiquinone biosynthesis accessory factor UbiJ
MLQTVRELVLPAAQARVVLLINHVLSREPAATQRLQAHAGRHLRVELVDAPRWMPLPPPMAVTITPAGLFEADVGSGALEPDLSLRVSMPTPALWLDVASGQAAPAVRIDGAADLAADMHWLVDHLRWDIEGDLSQTIGATPARLVMSVGRAGAATLRRAFAGTGAGTGADAESPPGGAAR